MDRDELTKRYFEAWNQKDVSGLLKLMHPQASYYDAFWGEICSGSNLSKYLSDNLKLNTRWYRQDGEIIVAQDCLIIRYVTFDRDDHEGLAPIFNGAEVLTLSDGLIMTISDFYCDPNPIELIEIAMLAKKQHGRSNIAPLVLSAKNSGHIKRRMTGLADKTMVYLDSSLTVTQLADRVGCSVMDLFHVLEKENGTTFLQFVNECRVRHATTLMADASDGDIRFDRIAEQSGFETIAEFRDAFQSTFGMSADEYLQRFPQGNGLVGTLAETSEQSGTSAQPTTTQNIGTLLADKTIS